MKKQMIAVAVAAAFAAPMAMADAEVYGTAHVSVGQLDNSASNGDSLYALPNNSNIGVRGSEDLGGGLKAEYQAETALNWDAGGWGAGRDTFVGLGGDWGAVRVGRANTPFKNATASLDPFGDTVGDYNNIMGVGSNGEDHDTRFSNSLWYNTPSMSGFSGSVMYSMNDGADLNSTSGRERDSMSIGGSYKAGPIFVGAAYQIMNEQGDQNGGATTAGDATDDKYDDLAAWRVGASYTIKEATTIGLAYENVDTGQSESGAGVLSESQDRDAYFLSLSHKMGATTIAFTYADADKVGNTADTDADQYVLGVMQAMSKATSAYIQYTKLTQGSAGTTGTYGLSSGGFSPSRDASSTGDYEAEGIVVGVVHKFSSK